MKWKKFMHGHSLTDGKGGKYGMGGIPNTVSMIIGICVILFAVSQYSPTIDKKNRDKNAIQPEKQLKVLDLLPKQRISDPVLAGMMLPTPPIGAPAPEISEIKPAVNPRRKMIEANNTNLPGRRMKPRVTGKSFAVAYKPLKPKAINVQREKPVILEEASREENKNKPAPVPKKKKTNAKLRQNNHQKVLDGRILLRMREHGKGPTIDFAWPEGREQRRRLYKVFRDCYGMESAVLAADRRLFSLKSKPGRQWEINPDKYSSFLRSPLGKGNAEETVIFTDIARRHGLTKWDPVRIFPRNIDAVILAGFKELVGDRYHRASSIQGYYSLGSRRSVFVKGIRVDNELVAGEIKIPMLGRFTCSI